MSADKYLFRCSSIGKVMPGKRADFTKECTDELARIAVEIKYGRSKKLSNKYLEKGTVQEEESITLYSRFKKKKYLNNKARMSNDFITGEWDILDNGLIIDIKTSWDIFSFTSVQNNELNPDYYDQLQGYMALTGATKGIVAYCLVNTPENLIEQTKRSTWYRLGCPDESSDKWIGIANEIERNSIYDDIPVKERVFEFEFERDDQRIEQINQRVPVLRQWINDKYFKQ